MILGGIDDDDKTRNIDPLAARILVAVLFMVAVVAVWSWIAIPDRAQPDPKERTRPHGGVDRIRLDARNGGGVRAGGG